MKDFYSRKLEAFKIVDDLLQQVTLQGQCVIEVELLRQVARETGFSRAIVRYIADLIDAGKVKKTYNESGLVLLSWVQE